MAGRQGKREIDLCSIEPDPSMEVVDMDDSPPRAAVRLFAGLDEPPETLYRRGREDPGSLASIWEAVSRS